MLSHLSAVPDVRVLARLAVCSVVVHNYWQEAEDTLHAAFFEEAIVAPITEPRGAHFVVMSDFAFAGCGNKGHTCVRDGVENRAERCFEESSWEDCAAHAKPFDARGGAGMQAMTERHARAHFFDMYALFVSPGAASSSKDAPPSDASSSTTSEISINIPGTGVIWQSSDEYRAIGGRDVRLDASLYDVAATGEGDSAGFSSHMSLARDWRGDW